MFLVLGEAELLKRLPKKGIDDIDFDVAFLEGGGNVRSGGDLAVKRVRVWKIRRNVAD